MKISPYSVNVHWDRRYPKAGTALCPLQLFINLKTIQFKVGLRLYCTKEEFEKLHGTGGSYELKELRRKIQDYVRKAEMVLAKLPNPTREGFQRLFKSDTDLSLSHKTDLKFLFQEYADRLKKDDRIRSAENCLAALKSFTAYKEKIYFEDIDEVFLKSYVNWMTGKGSSVTTAQIYIRNLRTIFNVAIRQGYISERLYPFKQFTIGTSTRSKSVLYPAQVKQLWEYQPSGIRERRAKDMWMLCYLCNGINFKDAANLKNKNVHGDKITLIREKTKRTNKDVNKHITIFLHEEAIAIIKRWSNKTAQPNDFVLPFLNGTQNAEEREIKLKTAKRLLNKALNKIGKTLGLEVSLCLNLARHSFATTLKLSGTPLAFISDAMGHSNVKTTEHYLKSITDNHSRAIVDKLLQFSDDWE